MNEEAPLVEFAENALLISIPTKTPAELRKGILKGLRVAIKTHLLNEEKTFKESQALIYLLMVQEALEAGIMDAVHFSQAI